MKTNRIQGLTVMECMTDLDPALVAEAELDACFLPPLTAYQKKEHKKARREAARERREENPFFRFAGSGAGAVCISLVVAFALIAGIVYFINYGPKNPVAPGPGGQPEGTQAPAWGEGQIPTGEIDAAYTISTEQRMYETSPKRIVVTMRAKNPGVDIDYFHAFRIESLTDPAGELDFDCLWTEEWMERAEPVGKDEYAAWTKSVSINGVMPDGIYRIHHMEYDKDKGYVSAAFCDFAVGAYYGELLETGRTDALPDTTYPEAAPTPSDNYHVASVDIGYNDYGTLVLTVTYSADEPGVSIYAPSVSFRLEKVDGTPLSEELMIASTEEAIERVIPTDKNGGYAVWSKSHTVTNPSALLPGVYRLYALNHQNAILDVYDVYWDGETSEEQQPPVESTPTVPPVIEAPPLPSEAPHVLHNVSWHADETTGYLTLTYRAREKGETLSLREDELWFDFARLDTTERHRGVCFSSPELKNVTIEPDAATDGYAEYSITHTIPNPEKLPLGNYRVYAVNGMQQILDTLDVAYDGETMTVIPDDPTPGFTSDILLESVTLTREALTIYYTTPEKGQTMYYPSWNFRVEKIGGEANPAKIDFDSPELSIDYIDPTEEKNGYAVLGMRHYISLSDHDALLPGTYRIMALTWEGEVFDFIDVSFDGETSTPVAPSVEPPEDPNSQLVTADATLVINGVTVPCTGVKAQVVRIPEQDVGPVHYPSALSGRVPLLTVLRAIGAEVGPVRAGCVEITYKGTSYRLNLDSPSFASEDEPDNNYLVGIPGTVDSYAVSVGEDVLVDAYSVVYILRSMDGDSSSSWQEIVTANQIEFKKS